VKILLLTLFAGGEPETCNGNGLPKGLSSKKGVEGESDNGDSNTGDGGLPVEMGDKGVVKL
jgi:hypothetical protein